jgi:drug/metabolite transporter (DMT)-like permease
VRIYVGFLAEGLQRVPAGVGSVIIDSQPLTVAVVAALVFGESIPPVGVVGLLLGLAGLLLLELPEDQIARLSTLDFGALSMMQIYLTAIQVLSQRICWIVWIDGRIFILIPVQGG